MEEKEREIIAIGIPHSCPVCRDVVSLYGRAHAVGHVAVCKFGALVARKRVSPLINSVTSYLYLIKLRKRPQVSQKRVGFSLPSGLKWALTVL